MQRKLVLYVFYAYFSVSSLLKIFKFFKFGVLEPLVPPLVAPMSGRRNLAMRMSQVSSAATVDVTSNCDITYDATWRHVWLKWHASSSSSSSSAICRGRRETTPDCFGYSIKSWPRHVELPRVYKQYCKYRPLKPSIQLSIGYYFAFARHIPSF